MCMTQKWGGGLKGSFIAELELRTKKMLDKKHNNKNSKCWVEDPEAWQIWHKNHKMAWCIFVDVWIPIFHWCHVGWSLRTNKLDLARRPYNAQVLRWSVEVEICIHSSYWLRWSVCLLVADLTSVVIFSGSSLFFDCRFIISLATLSLTDWSIAKPLIHFFFLFSCAWIWLLSFPNSLVACAIITTYLSQQCSPGSSPGLKSFMYQVNV